MSTTLVLRPYLRNQLCMLNCASDVNIKVSPLGVWYAACKGKGQGHGIFHAKPVHTYAPLVGHMHGCLLPGRLFLMVPLL